ncbi:putative endolysin [Stenotrophomonas phage A1432]|uniref:Endolysin n=1 Tax=Stenotrophomonas phage A1432 TaxID=2930315 RepID=A0A9E7SRS0_9CAUD|nr:putative endolysin [Stenotrophomonas phage A1432]UTC27984.1 putative endolysin [Stenotrophomonas phage A1432]
MSFVLGSKSRANLVGVHPLLIKVVERAIQVSTVDFQVFEGLRTRERQAKLVASGASQTMDSRHLPGKDQLGHAVDLVPMIDFDGDGRLDLRWDWPLCYKVADAVRRASQELNIPIRWGGVWDHTLADLANDLDDETAGYVMRRKAQGKKAFLDGPHFELPVSLFP